MEQKVKYLIIGAGITGLSFANFINDDYLILEKEKDVGGFCRTRKEGEFVWDFAGHFFHFKDPDIKSFVINQFKSKDLIYQNKNTQIIYNNNYIDFPFQRNIHQLPKIEFIDCLYDLFNKNPLEDFSNFKEMIVSKFGKSIADKFLIPYNEKLYACDLNNLDKNAMGRFFPYANLKDIINNMKKSDNTSYNAEFMYPKSGAFSIIEAFLKKLDADKIITEAELIKIDSKNKIAYTNNKKIRYQYLINTSPFNYFLTLLNVKPNNTFTYNKVLVFNIGFNKPSINTSIHWFYIPSKEINFYRVGFYNNILRQTNLSLYIEIGFSSEEEINVEEQFELTLENLKKIGIIIDHEVVSSQVVIMDPAYVHISEKVQKEKESLMSILNQKNIFSIGRYGDWKYCSIEDCILDSKKLVSFLNSVEKL